METHAAPRARLHPLIATAAVAVTIASAVGIAALTGVIPAGSAKQSDHALVALAPVGAQAPTAAAYAPQPVLTAAPEPVPVPVAKPVVKAAPKPKPVVQQSSPVRQEPTQVSQATAQPREMYPPVPPDYRPLQAQAPVVAPRPVCFDCGVVESMHEVDKKGEGTGLGAVAGGIGGLIIGKQVGKGTGNKIATVLGAAGGAYAGHQIEKNARTIKTYAVTVRMDDGSYRTIAMDSQPVWRGGDHVRVVNGALQSESR